MTASRARPPSSGEPGALAALVRPLVRLAASALRAPRAWLAALGAVTVLFAAGLPRLAVRTDGGVLEAPGSASAERARRDRTAFGDGDRIIVLIASPAGGAAVASPDGLAAVRRLHEELQRIPGVRASGVLSPSSVRDLEVGSDTLAAVPFLERIPAGGGDFERWLRRLRGQEVTGAALLSDDGRAAAIHLPTAAGADRGAVLAAVERRLAGRPSDGFETGVLGPAVAEARLGDAVLADLAKLIPAMVAVIALCLWLCLRSPGGLLVTGLEVALVLVWSFGAMAWAGVPVTLVTTSLPVVLLAMAIADEVHVLERFQPRLKAALEAAPPGADPRPLMRRCLASSLEELAPPLIATTATTCAGLLAFCAATLPPLRHFGAIGAFGMAVALILSFTLVPALVMVLPARWLVARRGPPRARRRPARAMVRLVRHRAAAALAAAALVAVAVLGVTRLEVGDNWVANFAPDAPLVRADRAFNRAFWGSYRLDVVLRGETGLFHGPDGARLTAAVEEEAAAPPVRGSLSYLSAVEAVMRAHGERRSAAELPPGRLGDFVILAGMSEDPAGLGEFVTADGSTARVQLFLPGEDYRRDRALAAALERRLAPLASAAGVSFHLGGDIAEGLAMVSETVTSQLRSVGLSYLVIALFAVAVYPRGAAALAVLVPVLAGVTVVFGAMGALGIPLGVATSMFAGLSVGAGVDFGLHLVAAWRTAARRRGPAAAVARALAIAGRGVRWNAGVLAAGFAVLALSTLRPNHGLGLLLTLAVACSYGMTLLTLPALLAAGGRRRAARRNAQGPVRGLREDAA